MITYNTEHDPTQTGVYACRVLDELLTGMLADKFLIWMDSKRAWYYPRSDQIYRGDVLGWIGPLQRIHEHVEDDS